MTLDRVLSAHEVASKLGLDYSTVLRYLKSGKLAGSRDNGGYHIAESELTGFLRSHELLPGHSSRVSTSERLLSTREVADRLAVDPKTVVRYVKNGRLSGSRIGGVYRIPEQSVLALLHSVHSAASEPRSVVTAFANQRAGSGKTTTVKHVAMALRDSGHSVLMVDLDPQADLSCSFGIEPSSLTASVYQALLDDALDAGQAIRRTPCGIDILPATAELALAEVELVNMMQRELIVRDLVHEVRQRYDHILLDTASNLGLLTINALAAADQVLIPLPCDDASLRGLGPLLYTIDLVTTRLNRDLYIAGVLPFHGFPHGKEASHILDDLPGFFSGSIFAPPGDGAAAYAHVAEMLHQRIGHLNGLHVE